eukprot:1150622-Pelagomonas_calceolata.AAC.2
MSCCVLNVGLMKQQVCMREHDAVGHGARDARRHLGVTWDARRHLGTVSAKLGHHVIIVHCLPTNRTLPKLHCCVDAATQIVRPGSGSRPIFRDAQRSLEDPMNQLRRPRKLFDKSCTLPVQSNNADYRLQDQKAFSQND